MVVAMLWASMDTSFLFYPRLPFVESAKALLPQLDLTVVGAELLWSDLKILVRECYECNKLIWSGRYYFCVTVDRIPDMSVLASFTRVQHVVHGMLLPLLLCFPWGQLCKLHSRAWELLAAPVPAQGTARVGEVLGSSISCCCSCVQPLHRAKGSLAQQHWLSLCLLCFLLPLLGRRV